MDSYPFPISLIFSSNTPTTTFPFPSTSIDTVLHLTMSL